MALSLPCTTTTTTAAMLVFKMDTTGLFKNGQKHEIRISLPRDKHRAKPPPHAHTHALAPPHRRGSVLSEGTAPPLHHLHHNSHHHHHGQRRGSMPGTLRRHPEGELRAPRVPPIKEVRFALESGVWRPEQEEEGGARSRDEGSSSEGSSGSSSRHSNASKNSHSSSSSRSILSSSSSKGSSGSSTDKKRKKRTSSRSSSKDSREQVSWW